MGYIMSAARYLVLTPVLVKEGSSNSGGRSPQKQHLILMSSKTLRAKSPGGESFGVNMADLFILNN